MIPYVVFINLGILASEFDVMSKKQKILRRASFLYHSKKKNLLFLRHHINFWLQIISHVDFQWK